MSHTNQPARANEPIFWGLFGAGGMFCAFLTPILVLFTGILVPMGMVDAEAMSFERLHAVASTWWGALAIWVIISLPMWLTMHRIYHGLHDIGIHRHRHLQQVFFYGAAFAVTVASATLLLQLG